MTWHCAAGPAERRASAWPRANGIALLTTVIILLLVSAIGLGLALTTSLEPAAVANYEAAWRVRYGVEAALTAAVHDLVATDAWDAALAGTWRAPHLEPLPPTLTLGDGQRLSTAVLTSQATCGRDTCSDADASAFTVDRPWGPNNPRWQPVGLLRLSTVEPADTVAPWAVVVVWVGDDPAERDGDPRHDTALTEDGVRPPGACVVAVRAEAFSVRAAHRTLFATVGRPRDGCPPGPRVVSRRVSP